MSNTYFLHSKHSHEYIKLLLYFFNLIAIVIHMLGRTCRQRMLQIHGPLKWNHLGGHPFLLLLIYIYILYERWVRQRHFSNDWMDKQ